MSDPKPPLKIRKTFPNPLLQNQFLIQTAPGVDPAQIEALSETLRGGKDEKNQYRLRDEVAMRLLDRLLDDVDKKFLVDLDAQDMNILHDKMQNAFVLADMFLQVRESSSR